MAIIEVTKTRAQIDDQPVTKRLRDMKDGDKALYFTLFKQAKNWEPDGQWRYWEGVLRFGGTNFEVHCYMRLTRDEFTVKKLSVQREKKIIIN